MQGNKKIEPSPPLTDNFVFLAKMILGQCQENMKLEKNLVGGGGGFLEY